jgi:hypothetical protein
MLCTSWTCKTAYLAGIRVALFLAFVASGYSGAAAGTGKLHSTYTSEHHTTRYALFGYFFLHVFSLLVDVSHGINLPIEGTH